jgi:hypothetical protein
MLLDGLGAWCRFLASGAASVQTTEHAAEYPLRYAGTGNRTRVVAFPLAGPNLAMLTDSLFTRPKAAPGDASLTRT